jgi:hypothetical protein
VPVFRSKNEEINILRDENEAIASTILIFFRRTILEDVAMVCSLNDLRV